MNFLKNYLYDKIDYLSNQYFEGLKISVTVRILPHLDRLWFEGQGAIDRGDWVVW